jgi:hypothetical protein
MNWKQPIPTDLREVFGENYLAKHIYIELLLRARNSDEEKSFAGRLYFLKKGQCVCGEREIATEFAVNRKTVHTTLLKCQNVYNRIRIRPTTRGTVVTILNYDEVVGMGQQNGQQSNNRVTTEGQQSNTNKSVLECKNERVGEDSHPNFEKLRKEMKVETQTIERYYQRIVDYQASTGKTYKNIEATIRLWIREDIKKGKLERGEKGEHVVTDVERELNERFKGR